MKASTLLALTLLALLGHLAVAESLNAEQPVPPLGSRVKVDREYIDDTGALVRSFYDYHRLEHLLSLEEHRDLIHGVHCASPTSLSLELNSQRSAEAFHRFALGYPEDSSRSGPSPPSTDEDEEHLNKYRKLQATSFGDDGRNDDFRRYGKHTVAHDVFGFFAPAKKHYIGAGAWASCDGDAGFLKLISSITRNQTTLHFEVAPVPPSLAQAAKRNGIFRFSYIPPDTESEADPIQAGRRLTASANMQKRYELRDKKSGELKYSLYRKEWGNKPTAQPTVAGAPGPTPSPVVTPTSQPTPLPTDQNGGSEAKTEMDYSMEFEVFCVDCFAELQVRADIVLTLDFGIWFPPVWVDYFRAEIRGSITLSTIIRIEANAKLDYSRTQTHLTRPIVETGLFALWFRLKTRFELNAEATGLLQAGLVQKLDIRYGKEYKVKWGYMKDISKSKYNYEFTTPIIQVSGEATGRLFVIPSFQMDLISIVGVELDIEPYLQAKVDLSFDIAKCDNSISLAFQLGYGVNYNMKAKVFKFFDLPGSSSKGKLKAYTDLTCGLCHFTLALPGGLACPEWSAKPWSTCALSATSVCQQTREAICLRDGKEAPRADCVADAKDNEPATALVCQGRECGQCDSQCQADYTARLCSELCETVCGWANLAINPCDPCSQSKSCAACLTAAPASADCLWSGDEVYAPTTGVFLGYSPTSGACVDAARLDSIGAFEFNDTMLSSSTCPELPMYIPPLTLRVGSNTVTWIGGPASGTVDLYLLGPGSDSMETGSLQYSGANTHTATVTLASGTWEISGWSKLLIVDANKRSTFWLTDRIATDFTPQFYVWVSVIPTSCSWGSLGLSSLPANPKMPNWPNTVPGWSYCADGRSDPNGRHVLEVPLFGSTCNLGWLNDGECDTVNNSPECGYDYGDCCQYTCSGTCASFDCKMPMTPVPTSNCGCGPSGCAWQPPLATNQFTCSLTASPNNTCVWRLNSQQASSCYNPENDYSDECTENYVPNMFTAIQSGIFNHPQGARSLSFACVSRSSGMACGSSADCKSPNPSMSYPCGEKPCRYCFQWSVEEVGECSRVCGSGTYSRTIKCRASWGQLYSDTTCFNQLIASKPETSMSCRNLPPCTVEPVAWLQPKGEQQLYAGQTTVLMWDGGQLYGSVSIWVRGLGAAGKPSAWSQSGSAFKLSLPSAALPNSGSYSWTIPAAATSGLYQFEVRSVSAPAYTAQSEPLFVRSSVNYHVKINVLGPLAGGTVSFSFRLCGLDDCVTVATSVVTTLGDLTIAKTVAATDVGGVRSIQRISLVGVDLAVVANVSVTRPATTGSPPSAHVFGLSSLAPASADCGLGGTCAECALLPNCGWDVAAPPLGLCRPFMAPMLSGNDICPDACSYFNTSCSDCVLAAHAGLAIGCHWCQDSGCHSAGNFAELLCLAAGWSWTADSSSCPTPQPTAMPTTLQPTAYPTSLQPTANPTTPRPTTATPSGAPSTMTPTTVGATFAPSGSPTTSSPTTTPSSAPHPTTPRPTTTTPSGAPTTMTPTNVGATFAPSGSPTTSSPTTTPSSAPQAPSASSSSSSPSSASSSSSPSSISSTTSSPAAAPSSASAPPSPAKQNDTQTQHTLNAAYSPGPSVIALELAMVAAILAWVL